MTPREIVALALGVIVGALLNSRQDPCRRACCTSTPTRPSRNPIPASEQLAIDLVRASPLEKDRTVYYPPL